MSKDEALKLALEALERACNTAMIYSLKARIPECGEFAGIAQDLDFCITTLREIQAQPEQDWEAVAADQAMTIALLRAEQPPQRKPLTDEEIKAVIQIIDPDEQYLPKALRQFARAIEAAHGIKENT